MAISPLLTIAGTALAPLARDLIEQVSDGLSFQNLLGRKEDPASQATSTTDSAPRLEIGSSLNAERLEAIRRQPFKELEAYVERLRDRLAAAGIDLTESLPLKAGSRGDIQVDGGHIDRAAIEELLAADAQLSADFRLLANTLENLHNANLTGSLVEEFRLTLEATDFTMAFE